MKPVATLALLALALGAVAQSPYAGQGGKPPVDKAAMTKLAKTQAAADAAFKKSPKNPGVRQAYIDANNRHGLACMVTDAIDRKVKYRMALTDFRKVLKVDPRNKVAKENADLIVSIYRSMGRPIPG